MNLISKDDAGFIVENNGFRLEFSFKNEQIIKLYKEGKLLSNQPKLVYVRGYQTAVLPYDVKIDAMFKGLVVKKWREYLLQDDIITMISTEKTRPMFVIMWERMAKEDAETTKKMGRALRRLSSFPELQIVAASGAHPLLLKYVADYKRSCRGTTLHEIVGLPKSIYKDLVNFVQPPIYATAIGVAKSMLITTDVDTVRNVFRMMVEETALTTIYNSIDILNTLVKDYSYNMRQLCIYILRDVKIQQGITHPGDALRLLRDYIRMATSIKHNPDKYPESLKKAHDVMSMNYRVATDTTKEANFKKVIESDWYKKLEFGDKDFSIVRPVDMQEVVQEGKDLGHCVASYINDIIDQKCKILFLRPSRDLTQSLVTIEVKQSSIRQVKGKFNRKPSAVEKSFIKKWAEEKELEVCYG